MKTYKIKKIRKGRESIIEGDLDYLKKYFSYTFEVGCSWNRKIKPIRDIKTIKSFIKNLKASFEEQEAQCYERTLISLEE